MGVKEQTIEINAYHEAGHAVVNHLLNGRKAVSVSIIKTSESEGRFIRDPASADYFYPKSGDDTETLNRMYIEVAVGLAGDLAEMKVSGRYNGSNIEGDLKKALDMADTLMFHTGGERDIVEYIDEVSAEVKTLLEDKWPAVEALAQTLLERKELSGDEITNIIESALQ